jgi:hypothetical protein
MDINAIPAALWIARSAGDGSKDLSSAAVEALDAARADLAKNCKVLQSWLDERNRGVIR